MTRSELTEHVRRPELVALWLSVPAAVAAGIVLCEQALSRELWRRLSETVIGKLLGWLGAISGFVLAPLALLALLIYGLGLSFGRQPREAGPTKRSIYVLWLLFACAIFAYAVFWDAVRRASLSF